jgi:hypothetical protein
MTSMPSSASAQPMPVAPYTLSFGEGWRIAPSSPVCALPRQSKRHNGALKAKFRGRYLALEAAPAATRADLRPARPAADRSASALPRSAKPGPTHPWRTTWSKAQRRKNAATSPA